MAETTYALTHGCEGDADFLDFVGPTQVWESPGSDPLVSVGRPLPGVTIRVCDDTGMELAEGQIGELWVRSPFTMAGYYNNPNATAQAFHDGWYKTGDLGYRKGSAYFVRGRKKDLLIVSGVNFFPQDVEDLVSQTDGVRPGRVSSFASFDPAVQTDKVTVLAETEATGNDATDLYLRIRQRLVSCLQISNIEVQLVPPEWLIKSSAGKTARSANKEKWARENPA